MEELDLTINIFKRSGGIGFPLILTLYEEIPTEFPRNYIEKAFFFVIEGFFRNLCMNKMIVVFYAGCLF